jgi:xanthine dehydrogenase accessory factor
MRTLFNICVATAVTALGSASVVAASASATIVGTVTLTAADGATAAGDGARVLLACGTDATTRAEVADDNGAFHFVNVPVDSCSIEADVQGFVGQPVTIVTAAEQVAEIDLDLGISPLRAGVNVAGPLPPLLRQQVVDQPTEPSRGYPDGRALLAARRGANERASLRASAHDERVLLPCLEGCRRSRRVGGSLPEVSFGGGRCVNRRETERLLRVIREARASGVPAALATVIRVNGSAYRREGTRMLVRRDGTYECSLSGGCLEPAVAEAAAQVIATGDPVIVNYDLADDSIWGIGIGCSSAVDIRIERIGDDAMTNEWLAILESGDAAVLVTPLAGVSGRMIVRQSGDVVGDLTDPAVEQRAIGRARALLATPYPGSGSERVNDAEVFYEAATPPPDLVIFGAGNDAAPVAELAWTLGFAVTVVDAREAFLTPERFGGAALVCAHFSQFGKRVTLRPGSYALIMNHHFERDQESLRFSLESDAVYIGVLGPRARYDKLLAGLAERGYVPDSAKTARVRSPVGLALGAETPEEVATSIAGELIATLHGFEGGSLSGSNSSLHRPEDKRTLASS